MGGVALRNVFAQPLLLMFQLLLIRLLLLLLRMLLVHLTVLPCTGYDSQRSNAHDISDAEISLNHSSFPLLR